MRLESTTLVQLKDVGLFTSLSNRQLKQVVSAGKQVDHRAGQPVVTEGHGSYGLHLITAGSALVDVGGATREPLGVGDYFGELSLLDGKPRAATITAGPDGLATFVIRSFDFARLLEKHPEMNRPIIEVLCRRLREEHARAGHV